MSEQKLDIRYYKQSLTVNDNLHGFISISTFWTPKDKIEQLIEPNNYEKILTIGQLYTYEGLKYIQYNTFANPRFKIMILTGFDNNNIIPKIKTRKSNFHDFSCEEEWWKYWGFNNNKSNEELQEMIKNVDGVELLGNIVFLNNYKLINELLTRIINNKPSWIIKPIILPPPNKHEFINLNSEKTGFTVRDSDLCELWKKGLTYIEKYGTMVDGTREIMNLISVLTDEPKICSDFPAFEQAEQYIPQVCDSIPTNGMTYTYGSRIHQFNQIDEIINSLSSGLFNRNGVATTWCPQIEFGNDYHNSPPCLILVMFKIQPISYDNINTNSAFKQCLKSKHQHETFTHMLYVNSVFRSHDYYKAMPLNLYAIWHLGQKVLNKIQERIGNCVRIKQGPLTNLSISAHVYEQDFKKMSFITSSLSNKLELDPRGYFVISLSKNRKIHVSFMSPNDKEVESWESEDVEQLERNILIYVSNISHAIYIGRELQRAKDCLDNNEEYVQN